MNIAHRFFQALAAGALVALLAPGAFAAAEISPRLQQTLPLALSGEPIAVIVTFSSPEKPATLARREGPRHRGRLIRELKSRAGRSQAALKPLLRRHGIEQVADLWLINAAAFSAPAAVIFEVAALPGVEMVSDDALIHMPEVQPAAEGIPGWNISRVRAPDLWARGIEGQGSVVAILDTGVHLGHPDLTDGWRGGTGDWFDPYTGTALPYDFLDPETGMGHGTAVAGIAVGKGSGGTAIGVAPAAQWIAAKIFRDDGIGQNSRILQALQWALNPHGDPETDDAPDVVNLSWGYSDSNSVGRCVDPTGFRDAIGTLRGAGIAVVVSAGNSGPDGGTSISPANYPESLAVGATTASNNIASFSARGPSACPGDELFPDLVAPGVNVSSANLSGGYLAVSGTSFSAPHLAGAIALLRQTAPSATVNHLTEALSSGAVDLGVAGPDFIYGHGLLDIPTSHDALNPFPAIAVLDSAFPRDDMIVAFGHVAPGAVANHTLTVQNIGADLLKIGTVDLSGVAAPFGIDDQCSGVQLSHGQSCVIGVRFAPVAFGRYEAVLRIPSNDPDQADALDIALTGNGNTPPTAPSLISPADGATVESRVTLFWQRAEDADGDAVSHTVLLSGNADFTDAIELIPVAAAATSAAAALAGMVLLGVRRRRITAALFLSAGLLWLAACGGGGGASPHAGTGNVSVTGEAMSVTAAGLTSGRTYYWKVIARDERGGAAESAVRSFTVK